MRHGQYVSPGNAGFKRILNSEYIDKTGLIAEINKRICSPEGLVCISRPRRFGKSFAAQMLCAYYDVSCDSRDLFQGKEISETDGYEKHLNKYYVISLDITSFLSVAKRIGNPIQEVPNMIVKAIHDELVFLFPELSAEKSLSDCLLRCAEGFGDNEGRQFVFIMMNGMQFSKHKGIAGYCGEGLR